MESGRPVPPFSVGQLLSGSGRSNSCPICDNVLNESCVSLLFIKEMLAPDANIVWDRLVHAIEVGLDVEVLPLIIGDRWPFLCEHEGFARCYCQGNKRIRDVWLGGRRGHLHCQQKDHYVNVCKHHMRVKSRT